jgi:hypothetical protein
MAARTNTYCTVEQLAQAVRTTVTAANTDYLQRCCDAASDEIDADLDVERDAATWPVPDVVPAIIVSVAIVRAVEWYKANDAAYGVIGYTEAGALKAPKDTFARHAAVIDPYWKMSFGLA